MYAIDTELREPNMPVSALPRSKYLRLQIRQCLRRNSLSILMIFGVLIGTIVGITLQVLGVRMNGRQMAFIKFPGEIFLQMMKMVMIPVVVTSLITATADIEIRLSGKIGLRAVVYYLVTVLLASSLGILLCLTVQPGRRAMDSGNKEVSSSPVGSPLLAILDIIRNIFPDNLIEACFVSKSTYINSQVNIRHPRQSGNETEYSDISPNRTDPEEDASLVVVKGGGPNMIGIVVVSIATGCIISYVGETTKPFYDLIVAVRVLAFKFVALFIWYAPIGISFLILSAFSGVENLSEIVHNLVVFVVTVLGGVCFHGLIVLPLFYLMLVRKNPYRFLRGMFPAMLVAFGSDSSSAALPVTIKCLEKKNCLDSRVARLVASVGATVNMDGAAFYFSIMTIFLAQLSGITLSAGQVVSVSVISTAMSIGMGCVSGAQYAYIIIIPTSLNLPIENVGLLLAIDWITSRCRTTLNIMGDSFGAGIVEALSKKDMKQLNASRDELQCVSTSLLKTEDTV